MNGRSVLAGLQGFQEGFRFGRELMGDSPEDRAARARLAESEAAAGIARQKQEFQTRKLGMDQANKDREYDRAVTNDTNRQQNAEAQIGIQAGNLALNNTRYNTEQERYAAGEPLRNAQLRSAQDKVRQSEEDAAYRQSAQQNLGDFQAVINGTASPEQVERAKRFFPMVAQDATAASAALRAVAQKSAAFLQRGDTESADAVWTTPEGQAAMNAGFGPLFSRRVGQTDYDGLHVVTGARAVGVTRSPDGQRLGFKIETTQEPTPEFRARIEQQIGAASSEEERNGLRELLKPHTYVADMTEGRVPVSQGGQTKYFTKEDFANGVQLLDHIGAWQRQNPDQVEELQTLFMGAASGQNAAQGMERQQIEMDKLLARRAKKLDLAMKSESLAMKRSGVSGENKLVESKIRGLQKVTSQMMPVANPDSPDQVLPERRRVAGITARAEDIIRERKGEISLEEAIARASAEVPPVPRSSEETHDVVANVIKGSGANEHPIKSDPVAEGIRSNPKLTREKKVQMLMDLGYTNEDF